MRQIGHLANEEQARVLGDFLYAEGIDNNVEPERNGTWALWILDEDQLDAGNRWLEAYRANPADPKYRQAGVRAGKKRAEEDQKNAAARKRWFDSSKVFPSVGTGVGVLTACLIGLSVAIGLLTLLGFDEPIARALFISYYITPTLPELRAGELWRLVTPILVHGGVLHLFFNMMCLLDFGTMVERLQGTGRLAFLVLVIAIPSNLAQYAVSGPNFCGMSGVVYGLIGYIWMRGRFDPFSGLFLHSGTLTMALVWYFLCLANVFPHAANTVHTVGLGMGMALGYLSARFSRR